MQSKKIIVKGFDGNKDFTVSLDCAYTYFWNYNVNTGEYDKIVAAEMGYAAFIIIDNDGADGTVTGFGYCRLYADAVADDKFMFDTLYADKKEM